MVAQGASGRKGDGQVIADSCHRPSRSAAAVSDAGLKRHRRIHRVRPGIGHAMMTCPPRG